MLHILKGSLFDREEGILVHGVNCEGVMGAGVAKAMRNFSKGNYENYKTLCKTSYAEDRTHDALLGTVLYYEVEKNLFIANVFSQKYPGADARYEAISSGLRKVFRVADKYHLPIHSVKIGCGIGGLDWYVVEKMYSTQCALFPDVECTIWHLD